ncbi:MAG: DUF302 domain-containing protein [Halobacteria archaeon]|nr:DUF302 domain-containing protein [Halobacteria archaeon]
MSSPPDPSPTSQETLHATLDMDFEDAVLSVQLEHELAGFETVNVTRLDNLIKADLDEERERTALVVVCHAEIARDTIDVNPQLAGLLPCTTVVYETPEDDLVHVHHISVTKAIRDLGFDPGNPKLENLVEKTGELMSEVWSNIESFAHTVSTPETD